MVETLIAEAGYTREQRTELDRLDDRLLGRLTFADERAVSEIDELEREIGIPRPAWFTPQLPTLTDVANAGLARRRS